MTNIVHRFNVVIPFRSPKPHLDTRYGTLYRDTFFFPQLFGFVINYNLTGATGFSKDCGGVENFVWSPFSACSSFVDFISFWPYPYTKPPRTPFSQCYVPMPNPAQFSQ